MNIVRTTQKTNQFCFIRKAEGNPTNEYHVQCYCVVPVVLQGEHVNSSLVTRAAQPFVCQTAQNMQKSN